MTDLREHWAEVERLLRGALQAFGADLDAKTIEVVSEYLDHNELELALRSIQFGAKEQNIATPDVALQHLKRAAFLMRVNL